jgi:hypothetical protein
MGKILAASSRWVGMTLLVAVIPSGKSLLVTHILPLSDLKGILISAELIDPNSLVVLTGNLHDLPNHRIAIINSRQHRTAHADDTWLSTSITALENAISRKCTTISSVGMVTWEWIVWNTHRLKGYQLIVVPRGKASEFSNRVNGIIGEFDLDIQRTTFVMPFHRGQSPRRTSTYPERDRWVAALSHCVFPISVRRSGNFAKLLKEPMASCQIDASFQVPPPTSSQHPNELQALLSKTALDSKINCGHESGWDYLTHWTRSCHGPWLGERKTDYYQDLFRAKSGDPRDALNTLKRILKESRIRGSGRLVRGGEPMVSLTAKSPSQLLDIIRWRPGFIRWNFEPYGISIKRQALESLGARPVIYGSENQYQQLSSKDKLFFQPVKPDGKNWQVEEEWRLPGDLDLLNLRHTEAMVWVMNHRQIAEIQTITSLPVHSLTK